MIISLIVAIGKNWEIGLNNEMLWHIPEDFKSFKKITSGHCVLMGSNTLKSIKKQLPNRKNIILTSKKDELLKDFGENDDLIYLGDILEAIKYAKQLGEKELFVIGGGSIYKYFIENNLCDKLYISEVDFSGKADTYLENIDYSKYDLIEQKNYSISYNEFTNEDIPSWTLKTYRKK